MPTPPPSPENGFPGAVPQTEQPTQAAEHRVGAELPAQFPAQFPDSAPLAPVPAVPAPTDPAPTDPAPAGFEDPAAPAQLRTRRRPWTQPEEEPEDAQRFSAFSRSARHGDPGYRRAWRAAARVVVNDAFPTDYAAAVDRCQHPVTTGRRIGIIGATGGTGKSTLAAAMGLLLSGVRVDHIAAVDLAGRPSGLLQRLPSEEQPAGVRSLAEVAAGRQEISLTDLRSHSAQLRSTLHRITLDDADPALRAEHVAGTFQVLSHTCAVSLIELPELSPELGTAGLSSVHALILAVGPSPAAVEATRSLLRKLQQELPETPVIPVIVDTRRARTAERRAAVHALKTHLRETGHPHTVHLLDADRHLGGGLRISLKRVGEQRRLQLAQLAAAALGAASAEPARLSPAQDPHPALAEDPR